MDTPEWAGWEIFEGATERSKNQDVMKMYLDEWVKDWKVEELWHQAQSRRICFAPVFGMEQLSKQEQLRSRNFFVEVNHPKAGTVTQLGPPYQLREPWWQIRRPAPLLGQHTDEVLDALPPAPAPRAAGSQSQDPPSARRRAGGRLHLGLGRPLRHDVSDPPRGRGHQDRVQHPH